MRPGHGGLGGDIISEFPDFVHSNGKVYKGGTYVESGFNTQPLLLNPPATIARHHVFPNTFRKWFAQRGIDNIDDYTIEMEHWNTHLRGVHGKGLKQFNLPGRWNSRWAGFIKTNPSATSSEIFKFGEDLMSEYGFRFSKFVKYR